MNNHLRVILITLFLIFGTIPFTVGAASSKAASTVTISYLDLGGEHTPLNDEFVVITNKGTKDVKLSGWVIKDKIIKHIYKCPSNFLLKAHKSVEIYT